MWLVPAGVLVLAAVLGRWASPLALGLLVVGIGSLAVLARPTLGVAALIAAALLVPFEINSGTDVKLNVATLLVPALAVIWLLDALRRRQLTVASTRANLPLVLFLLTGILALLIGRATWDPLVPVGDNFLLVQLAQWSIFAFSALAFWLMANLVRSAETLQRVTAFFLLIAGGVAILRLVPGLDDIVGRVTSLAFIRAPLWMLLASLAAGQLLFNRRLSLPWRIFLGAALLAAIVYAFIDEQEAVSNWLGLVAAMGTLVWLRYPRLRWPLVMLFVIMAAMGLLFPAIYNFAGGDQEWQGSGASRLVLMERVVEVTLRNPITGLGPAAYRSYAAMEPLKYGAAFWVVPNVNSHNNYVDIFSHAGLLGLALFGWFMVEITRLAWRLHRHFNDDFMAGYANAMLAAIMAILVIMLLLDWFLPFVYNVSFRGFQASVLVWLFLGGLVTLEGLLPNTKPVRNST